MKKIEAVIFDMDGLMFDTEPLYFETNVVLAEKRGKTYTHDLHRSLMGKRALHVMEGVRDGLKLFEDAATLLDERNVIFKKLLETRARMMPGLLELLDFLKANNIRKAIGTSSSNEWVDTLLGRFGISDRFETIVTGNEVQHGKPHPEIYLTALARLDLPAASYLVLEDAIHGVHAGKAAGCVVGAVPNSFTEDQDFSAADHVFSSLNDRKLYTLLTEMREE